MTSQSSSSNNSLARDSNSSSVSNDHHSPEVDKSNLIRSVLSKGLDSDSFSKFTEVLNYIGADVHEPLYSTYNDNLVAQLNAAVNYEYQEGYNCQQHLHRKASFFAFKFIGNIGKLLLNKFIENDYKSEKNYIRIAKILLYHSLLGKTDSANLALVELYELCKFQNITPQELYYKYKNKFLRLIIKAILHKLQNNGDLLNGSGSVSNANGLGTNSVISRNCFATYMTRALEVFNVYSIKRDDVAQTLLIIALLAHKDSYDESIKIFLDNLASYQNMDKWSLLNIYIQPITVGMLLSKKLSKFDVGAALEKLASFCNKEVRELFQRKISFIKAELLLHYSVETASVNSALCYLAQIERKSNQSVDGESFENPKVFIKYLIPDMVGILLGVDSYVNSHRNISPEERIIQVESLSKILSLMNSTQIQDIHHKLLSSLQLFLNLRSTRHNQDLNLALKELWNIFVTKLNKELRVSLFLNICVSLYDLLEDCPEVASIYEIFFMENIVLLEDQLKYLFFIQNTPSMSKVYNYLKPYILKDNSVSNIQELQKSLECVIPLMKLENQKSRLLALDKMRDLIKTNQQSLLNIMLLNKDEPLNSFISKTIESLISLSSTHDPVCSNLIAECLGMLGAVNPIRLDHLIYGDISGAQRTNYSSLSSNEFRIELIERLKVSLFSDRINESESANYALQVVIRNCNDFESTIKSKLSEGAKRACSLCQNTLYGGYKKPPSDITTSVYEKLKTENLYSYKDWLEKFSWNLISTISKSVEKEILEACSYVFKYNYKFAEYLLPYAVTHIITHQPSHTELIRKEIMSILDENLGVSTQDLDDVYSNDYNGNAQSLHLQCANMIFCCIDACSRLEHEYIMSRGNIVRIREKFKYISEFNKQMPKDLLALLASKCRSHARTLYYFDQYLSVNKDNLDKYATELQKALIALDDTYEASGVEMVRSTPTTITDEIANYEACGRFDKAYTCCLTTLDSIQDARCPESIIEDSLRCLSNLGDHQRLYEKASFMLNEYSQYKRNILPYAVEATWKLGRWDELDYTFKNEQLVDSLMEFPNVSQGYLLLSTLNEPQQIPEKLMTVRNKLMKPLSIALMDRSAYFRGYQSLIMLHSIGDFTLAQDIFNTSTTQLDENTIDTMRALLNEKLDCLIRCWNRRNSLVEPSLKTLEPLRMWQKSISVILSRKYPFLRDRINIDIGKMWLTSADSAREAGNFDRSFYSLTQAQKWFGDEFNSLSLDLKVNYHILQAKLDWDQGEKTKAIRCLKLSLERLKDHRLYNHLQVRRNVLQTENTDSFPHLNDRITCAECSKIDIAERSSFAKLKILLTQYCEEAAAGIPETLFFMYEECVHLGVNQEETYFRLARYYDKLLTYYMDNPKLCNEPIEERNLQDPTQRFSQTLRSGDREDVYTKLMEHSIIAFGNSLKYGVKYLRESMPRLLTIWYDLGSKKSKTTRVISSRIESTIRFMDELKRTIPPYYFMTATSLILSRICHPHSGISKKTCEIIELLLTNYPQQLTWLLMAVLNDKDNEDRKRAAKLIISTISKKRETNLDKIINDTIEFVKLISELNIKLTDKDIKYKASKNKRPCGIVPLNSYFPQALRFDFTKCKVIVPVLDSMRAILPMDKGSNLKNHVVFPENNGFCIESIMPNSRLFNSLQKPKAISLRCVNGKTVSIILKTGDDLRKDSRCTEFLDLLNKILRRNSLSNARFVEIRTFLVLPLEADAGIIEMVPACEPVRGLLEKIYREKDSTFNLSMTLPKKNKEYTPQELLEGFKTQLLPKTMPPALPTWFLRNFPEPTSWYMARLAYTRSTAVISMGGYIIGLGDRHLDNILLDTKTGGIVHVDFNLLFHQGETLPTPERVPFRLTHNIVAGFGPVGTEGNFRKVCEIAMGVMRKEKDALLTTLKPFLFDPCSEWIKVREFRTGLSKTNEQDDKHVENKLAKFRLDVIERKLRGFPRSQKFKPLILIDSYSVEAQVDNLIEEASNIFNLAQMYFGWCPQV